MVLQVEMSSENDSTGRLLLLVQLLNGTNWKMKFSAVHRYSTMHINVFGDGYLASDFEIIINF